MGWFSRKPSQEELVDELSRKKEMLRLLEDPTTIFQLGLMAFDGDGQKQDYGEAAAWFKIAADQGHSGAQHNLALMYEDGLGIAQDHEQALEWYLKAAKQGNAGSQNNLGQAYLKGQGVQQNYLEAANWFHKAAEQNLASSQYYLGLLYSLGNGVVKDMKAAKKWLQLAADQNFEKAQELLEEFSDEVDLSSSHPYISDIERKMEIFIDDVTRIIYKSEQDLFTILEKDFLADLDPFDKFIAYIAISVAASARYKIRKVDVELVLERKVYPQLHLLRDLRNLEDYTQFLEVFKIEAQLELAKIEIDLMIGKLAYDTDKHSYNGILYNTAKTKLRPLSQDERQEARILMEQFASKE
jgi:hypothetical protein